MLSLCSRIWTRVAESISYDDNDYTTGTPVHCSWVIGGPDCEDLVALNFHKCHELHLNNMKIWLVLRKVLKLNVLLYLTWTILKVFFFTQKDLLYFYCRIWLNMVKYIKMLSIFQQLVEKKERIKSAKKIGEVVAFFYIIVKHSVHFLLLLFLFSFPFKKIPSFFFFSFFFLYTPFYLLFFWFLFFFRFSFSSYYFPSLCLFCKLSSFCFSTPFSFFSVSSFILYFIFPFFLFLSSSFFFRLFLCF